MFAAGEELLGLVGEGVRSGAITRRGARLIVLHRIHGLSTREIADAEGRDAAAVRKYRNRAEAALADVAEAVA
jgi:DNA-directed RNA polymerase specialized sigma24 family protein